MITAFNLLLLLTRLHRAGEEGVTVSTNRYFGKCCDSQFILTSLNCASFTEWYVIFVFGGLKYSGISITYLESKP
jgi:hypothetical protein